MEKIGWTNHVRNEEVLRSQKQQKEGRPTGLDTSCIGTAFYNTLLKGK
jgi:hypothetical protein